MELIIGAIGVLLLLMIVGLFFRSKGDGALDTIGAGRFTEAYLIKINKFDCLKIYLGRY
jgi:hypothetical protein